LFEVIKLNEDEILKACILYLYEERAICADNAKIVVNRDLIVSVEIVRSE